MKIFGVANKILRSIRLRTAIRSLFYILTLKFAVVKLKREANRCKSVENHVGLAFNIFNAFPFKRWRIRPGQVKEEIMELLKILAKHRPKFMLEIGTAGGGTLFLFIRVATSDATLISVDLPGGPFGGGYVKQKTPYYASFALPGQKIYLLRMDSHKKPTLHAISTILGGHGLDFLFIDGDHTCEGVRKDFEMYSKLLNPAGIIAFHDIVPGPPEYVGGVPRFWDEIKHNFSYIELVKDWEQGGCGIGVIYV
jgi:predicted O-methyltransferase YrrM